MGPAPGNAPETPSEGHNPDPRGLAAYGIQRMGPLTTHCCQSREGDGAGLRQGISAEADKGTGGVLAGQARPGQCAL